MCTTASTDHSCHAYCFMIIRFIASEIAVLMQFSLHTRLARHARSCRHPFWLSSRVACNARSIKSYRTALVVRAAEIGNSGTRDRRGNAPVMGARLQVSAGQRASDESVKVGPSDRLTFTSPTQRSATERVYWPAQVTCPSSHLTQHRVCLHITHPPPARTQTVKSISDFFRPRRRLGDVAGIDGALSMDNNGSVDRASGSRSINAHYRSPAPSLRGVGGCPRPTSCR